MKRKKFEILLAIIQILLAFWYFDWNSWTSIIVAGLLFLSGVMIFLTGFQSKILSKIKEFIYIIGFLLVFILLIKILLIG